MLGGISGNDHLQTEVLGQKGLEGSYCWNPGLHGRFEYVNGLVMRWTTESRFNMGICIHYGLSDVTETCNPAWLP